MSQTFILQDAANDLWEESCTYITKADIKGIYVSSLVYA